MMLWYDVVEAEVDRLIETDLTFAGVLVQTQQRMKSGFYTTVQDDYIDAMFQNWSHGYNIYDAYAFLNIHAGIADGAIARAQIYVGATPLSDKNIRQNHELLQNIPLPFRASFHGGNRDEDGALWWDMPVEISRTPWDAPLSTITVEPRCIALEVGYQKSSKTLMQLKMYRWVARWPYNSEWISLFAVLDEGWVSSDTA